MLRITRTNETPTHVALKVEGRIAGGWAERFEEECLSYRENAAQDLILDFSDVTFVDRKGLQALQRLEGEAMRIVNCSAFLRELLNGLCVSSAKEDTDG